MKKFHLLVACIMLTLFTGCAASNEAVAKPDNSIPPASEEQSIADVPNDEQEIQPAYEYTVAEICAGLREDKGDWKERYERPYFSWVTVDGEDYYYRHTYPSNEWSVSEVVDYYREHYYYWGDDPTAPYGECTKFYLWTPDYEHRFVANTEEHWLYIDGIKSAPLDSTSYSMDPKDLVEAFQSREWDGITRRYSDDFSTYATVVPQYGVLEYRYYIEYLSTERDPDSLAYTGYLDSIPWWEDETNEYDAIAMYGSAYTNDGGLNTPSTYGYGSYDDSGSSGSRGSTAWAIAYVDVPWDKQDKLWAVRSAGDVYPDTYLGESASYALYAGRTSDGLYAITDSGVELWRAGRLRQTWSLKMTPDSYLSTNQYYSDSIVVYADGRLYELFDDGEVGIIVDNIVSVNLGYVDTFCGFTLSKDGTLRICGLRGSSNMVSAEIATNVVAADLSDELLVLYTDDSGKTYAIYDFLGSDAGMVALCQSDNYKVACLGEGSIEHFKELCATYHLEHDGNRLQEQFIEEVAAEYLATISGDED